MAPTCAGCDPEVFEDLCYFPDPRCRKTYRPTCDNFGGATSFAWAEASQEGGAQGEGGAGDRRSTAPRRPEA
eukprot:3580832-Prymnesium_polylepis.1